MAVDNQVLSGVSIVFSLIIAALHGWLLYYLVNLQKTKCVCALGWRWYSIVAFIGIAFFNAAVGVFGGKGGLTYLPEAVQAAYVIFGMFNIYVILSYVHKLKKESCKCSEDIAREVLKIVAIAQLVIVIIAIVIAITMGHAIMKALKKAKRQSRASRRS